MKKLQVAAVKQASSELKELTNIFTKWGQSLYEGELTEEQYSTYELGNMTRNNMEVVGRVFYSNPNNIHDDFSLCEFTKKILEKYRDE